MKKRIIQLTSIKANISEAEINYVIMLLQFFKNKKPETAAPVMYMILHKKDKKSSKQCRIFREKYIFFIFFQIILKYYFEYILKLSFVLVLIYNNIWTPFCFVRAFNVFSQ